MTKNSRDGINHVNFVYHEIWMKIPVTCMINLIRVIIANFFCVLTQLNNDSWKLFSGNMTLITQILSWWFSSKTSEVGDVSPSKSKSLSVVKKLKHSNAEIQLALSNTCRLRHWASLPPDEEMGFACSMFLQSPWKNPLIPAIVFKQVPDKLILPTRKLLMTSSSTLTNRRYDVSSRVKEDRWRRLQQAGRQKKMTTTATTLSFLLSRIAASDVASRFQTIRMPAQQPRDNLQT